MNYFLYIVKLVAMNKSEFFQNQFWSDIAVNSFQSKNRLFTEAKIPLYRGETSLSLVFEKFNLNSKEIFTACRFGPVYFSDYFDFKGIDLSTLSTLNQIIEHAQNNNADLIWFSNIPKESQFYQVLKQFSQSYSNSYFLECIPTVGINLSYNYTKYLQGISRNCRHNILRKTKALDSQKAQHSIISATEENLQNLLNLQNSRSKANNSLNSFLENQEIYSFIMNLAKKSGIKISQIEINETVISQLLILEFNNTLAVLIQGFHQEFAKYSPSFVNLSKLIEYASLNGFNYIDLLRGKEGYKKHFINQENPMTKFLYFTNQNTNTNTIIDFIKRFEE